MKGSARLVYALLLGTAAAVANTSTAIFRHSTTAPDGTFFPCTRIPTAVAIPNVNGKAKITDGSGGSSSVVLAFAECRKWVGDGCEPHGIAPQPYVAYTLTTSKKSPKHSTDES